MRKMLLSISSALVFLAATAFAQSANSNQANLNQQDREFANMAAQANQGEIEMGTLAQQKASNDAVKQFAKTIVDDHNNAGQQLKSWASQSNFTLSTGLTPEDSSTKSSLSSLSGSQFDQKYIQSQLQDHKKAIDLFEKEASAGQDPQLKEFAQKTLPVLQDHMRIAEDLAGKLGMSGKMGLTDESKAVNSGNQPPK
jgi:putative membrane protein